jgi:hypothetical protein
LSRLAACVERGLDLVRREQEAIRRHVETIREVAATLDPSGKKSARRRSDFDAILACLDGDDDPIHKHMAGLMQSFRPGLFVGGDKAKHVQDNLDLERWFRLPKGHERRIHGHRHAGVRIVQEGPTMMLALGRRSRPNVGLHGLCSVDGQSGGLSFGDGREKRRSLLAIELGLVATS